MVLTILTKTESATKDYHVLKVFDALQLIRLSEGIEFSN